MNTALPKDFADLAAFADTWSLPSEHDRHLKRITSSLDEVRAFYKALFPRMDAICRFLDRYPVAEFAALPAEAKNLHYLALAFMEVSHPVDMGWRTTDVDDAFPSSRFEFLPPSNVR
jgi:hypothetical protein